jgi:hypothetical protein
VDEKNEITCFETQSKNKIHNFFDIENVEHYWKNYSLAYLFLQDSIGNDEMFKIPKN